LKKKQQHYRIWVRRIGGRQTSVPWNMLARYFLPPTTEKEVHLGKFFLKFLYLGTCRQVGLGFSFGFVAL